MRPRLSKLTPEYNIKPFDCEDADLNGFLLETDHSIPNARHHGSGAKVCVLRIPYYNMQHKAGRASPLA